MNKNNKSINQLKKIETSRQYIHHLLKNQWPMFPLEKRKKEESLSIPIKTRKQSTIRNT